MAIKIKCQHLGMRGEDEYREAGKELNHGVIGLQKYMNLFMGMSCTVSQNI